VILKMFVRFEIVTLVWKIQVFWKVTPVDW
jgi:hypothetical protein